MKTKLLNSMRVLLVAAGLCMGANAWAGDPTAWGDGTGKSWTSPTTGTYYSGSTISLKGVTITLGSADDASHEWSYDNGLKPAQMPTTDGTASTLITTFSAETPFGTLPTKGCFLKIVPSEDGKVTINCKPSTGSGQSLVFVTATADAPTTITAAAIDVSTAAGDKEYDVTNGNVYYFFQLAYSGQLTGYRPILKGVSFTSASLSEAYLALQSAYKTAKAFYDASVEGTGLFCYSTSARSTFNTVLEGAKTLLDGTPTDAECTSKTTDVNNALATFKAAQNKPDAEKCYYIKYGELYLNLNSDQKWSDATVYMPVLSNQPYAVKFEAKDDTENAYYIKNAGGSVYIYKQDGNYATALGDKNNNHYFLPEAVAGGDIKFKSSWQGTYYFASGTPAHGAVLGVSSQNVKSFTVSEASQATATANITSAQWATFVAPFDVTLPTGVTAYTCTYTNKKLTTTATGSKTVGANTPVLLHSESTYTNKFTGYAQSYWSGKPESNSLVGTLSAITLDTDGTVYLLQKQDEVVGWYQYSTGTISSTANRAYLKVPAAAPATVARRFIPLFDESEPTGITQVNGEDVKANAYYNLKGQRVSQPTKGLYIVGGKKVMVK